MTAIMPLPAVDFSSLSELQTRMTAFTRRFDHFVASGRERLRKERGDFTIGMTEDRSNQRALVQAIEETQRDQADLEQRVRDERAEAESIRVSIDAHSEKAREMQAWKTSLEQQLTQLRATMTQKRSVIAAAKQQLAVQNDRNKPEQESWETQLGLRIDSAGTDLLRFTFTQINHRDVKMPHFFVINLTELEYCVDECHPSLQSMPARVAELNKTRNFSTFLKQVRRDFKSLY